MIKCCLIVMGIMLLVGCSQPQEGSKTKEVVRSETSRFYTLNLNVGMNREDVEKQVSALLGEEQQYNPYGKNLRGGTVQYRDGDWVLEVTYKAGAPAPWVETPDGETEHLPPIDETVLEYRIEKIPGHELKARDKSAP